MIAIRAPNVEIVTTTETNATPIGPKMSLHRSRQQSGVKSPDRVNRIDVQVGGVGGEIDADDHQRADDDRARQVALRIGHLAGGEG